MTYRTGWNDERFGSGDLLLGQLVYKRMSERAAISADVKNRESTLSQQYFCHRITKCSLSCRDVQLKLESSDP